MEISVIITAAGSSSRMGIGSKKEFLPMKEGTVLSETVFNFLDTFCSFLNSQPQIKSFIVTYSENFLDETKKAIFCNPQVLELCNKLNIKIEFVPGAETRQLSVFQALDKISKNFNQSSIFNTISTISTISNTLETYKNKEQHIVLIHDGARPWVTANVINNVIECCSKHGSAVPATPITDTIATVSLDNTITNYIDRSTTYTLQTPQGFNFAPLYEAHLKAQEDKRTDCTDDTTIWAAYCSPVHICKGEVINKKITFQEDIKELN